VRPPKVLAVVSSVDLGFRYGCTPAWWQLWKGLYEAGVDLIVTPYRGPPIESPWWRVYENPCYRQGETFAKARDLLARVRGDTHIRRQEEGPEESGTEKLTRELIWRVITPRWRDHIARILEKERDVQAVVVFTVPISHLRGIAAELGPRYDVPFVYYDADVPMSLPEFGGMDTGFNIYHGADPGEYDLFLSNSEGGLERLRELGARRAEALFWGADPEVFTPLDVEKQYDVSFYAYGDKFRRDWMGALVGEPSRRLPDVDFVLGGRDFKGDTGRAREIGDVPTNVLSRVISSSRINLNLVRKPHATVPYSSTSRLFELASSGAAIVCSPYEGIERWFEPGEELRIVHDADEAVATYEELLADPGAASELGWRARERVLAEHTFQARARRLLDLVGVDAFATV
jgi:glycosyltransferase involved in cell wall biosynthesis